MFRGEFNMKLNLGLGLKRNCVFFESTEFLKINILNILEFDLD